MPHWLRLFAGNNARTVLMSLGHNAHLGHKSVFKPLRAIKEEVQAERLEIGDTSFMERLAHEEKILGELQSVQEEHQSLVSICCDRILSHKQQGLNPFGSFWKKQQDVLNAESSPEERELLADTVDWLKARRHVAKDLVSTKMNAR